MAGAGYKLFNTGDVLTAAQVNTYLQEQVVMVFNDATARTTALSGVLAEGMVSYLKSTKVVEIYNGTAWASLDDPNAIQNTIVDAKADLITATSNDTPARLAVGSNNQTIVADSATATGLKYANGSIATLTAKGDLLAASAANTPARLAVGSNGQFLTADSSTATGLAWGQGSGMTLLTSGTLSGSSLNTGSFSTAYTDLIVYITNFLPSNDDAGLYVRFNADSGANRHIDVQSLGTTTAFTATSAFAAGGNDNAVGNGLIRMEFPRYSNTTTWKFGIVDSITINATTTTSVNWRNQTMLYNQTSAISSFLFLPSSGNFTSGTYEIYGRK